MPHLPMAPVPHFYPRSPCGERHGPGPVGPALIIYFYPRSPCGERLLILIAVKEVLHFYPRSPCGERLRIAGREQTLFSISIHALLAESDELNKNDRHQANYFYPRSPCGERRVSKTIVTEEDVFLSTLSLRRATKLCRLPFAINCISIHALLAESDPNSAPLIFGRTRISIHALLAESDEKQRSFHIRGDHFYPRSPCGERPPRKCPFPTLKSISIHALLAESDLTNRPSQVAQAYFYPRSPCGERQMANPMNCLSWTFLSTLSLRRATWRITQTEPETEISIHALLAESDYWATRARAAQLNFYPRSPCGDRLCAPKTAKNGMTISIHALLAESDQKIA